MIGGHGREFLGAMRYEFRMQVRRRVVWMTFALLALLYLFVQQHAHPRVPQVHGDAITNTAFQMMIGPLPIAVAALLADRLTRDRRTRVDELLDTLPASLDARVWGKYVGSTLAIIVPFFLVYSVNVGTIIVQHRDYRLIPMALMAFVLIDVPGLLFVAAFSVACPVVLWMPLYLFLFFGYWVWGNAMDPHLMPTLSETWLAPCGRNVLSGIFHNDIDPVLARDRTIRDAIGSIALLLVCAVIPLITAQRYLRWQRARA